MLYFDAPDSLPLDLLRATTAVTDFFDTVKADPVECALCAASFESQCRWGMWDFAHPKDAPAETWEFVRLNDAQLKLKDTWWEAEKVFFEVAYKGEAPSAGARLSADIPLPLIGVRDERYESPPPPAEIAQRQIDSNALKVKYPDWSTPDARRAVAELEAKWDQSDRERIERRMKEAPLPQEFIRGPGLRHYE